MSLIYNATFDKNTRQLSFEDKAGNVIYSFTVPERGPAVDDITKPLTFRATQDGSTVTLTRTGYPTGSFQTSRDGGNTWTDYTLDSAITLNTGDEVSFRAKSDRTSAQSISKYFYFTMAGKIEAWHNVMSMYRKDDFATYESVVEHAFYRLFKDCTSLTKAPVLPATTLSDNCYYEMFSGCTSLEKAPALPATTLASECYRDMFQGCTSLEKAPALPATTLSYKCYSEIFKDCTSLIKAPVLPATTLAIDCYEYMFKGCTSLTKSPELPAATLNQSCYLHMFYGCSSLNEVHCKIPSSYSSNEMSALYSGSWLYNVSSTGTFYTNADANWPSGASGIPTGWTRVNEREKDDPSKPLTFKATQDGSTVSLGKNGSPTGAFQTSRDGGNTWTDYTLDSAITLNTGGEVSFRAKSDRTSAQSYKDYFYFMMEGRIEAWHNVMSMLRTNDFATYESVVNYAFKSLFSGCASLTKAPALPATTLAQYCYSGMFNGCTSLKEAPALPATTLADSCYDGMFRGCTSLTKAPELPATVLNIGASASARNCYALMFEGCTSLVKAPELPATTLEYNCYSSMFKGCTSLVKAPELPATTLASYCYAGMFNGCTSLTEAPVLPVTKLAPYCYAVMFKGCTSLVNAPVLPATTLADYCYSSMFENCTSLVKAPALLYPFRRPGCYNGMFSGCSRLNEVRCQATSELQAEDVPKFTGDASDPPAWLEGVSSTGKFYTNADANWPSGASGIPQNWTRLNINDYPTT